MAWTAWARQLGSEYAVLAPTREEAVAAVADAYRGPDEPSRTYWIDVVALRDDEERWQGRVPVHPLEPDCPRSPMAEHAWQSLRTGLVEEEVCTACGLRYRRDSCAEDPETGEQGLVSLQYLPPDETE